MNGVDTVGKRRENASRKMLTSPNPRRARGRAPWIKDLQGSFRGFLPGRLLIKWDNSGTS